MKKFLALILALMMVFALAACGEEPSEESPAPAESEEPAPAESETPDDETPPEEETPEAVTDANSIEDNITSDDGTYEVAFVTDVGQLHDKSFNEGTWNGVKLYAYNNGLTYKYYQPANGDQATDDDRVNAMQDAVNNGAKIVVCAGFLQEAALRTCAMNNPEVMFVFIDGYYLDDDPDPNVEGNILTNVAGINFQEEQAGYLAGYAVVKEGYTQLGFSGGGGGTNPACCRYGYGFLQGASAAAAEAGVDVNVKYSWQYGANFTASPDLQTMINGWYTTGTEVVFACGGSMFESISSAASANDGLVVGVDVDQSGDSDTVITSAMKGIAQAAEVALTHFYEGTWDEIGGVTTTLGATDDAVGLPTETWSLTNYTVEEYEAQLAAMKDGSLVVEADYPVDDTDMDDAASLNGVLPNITIEVI